MRKHTITKRLNSWFWNSLWLLGLKALSPDWIRRREYDRKIREALALGENPEPGVWVNTAPLSREWRSQYN